MSSCAALAVGLAAFALAGPARAVCPDCDLDGFAFPADCNDADPGTFPGAVEVCDGFDNDCNGAVDDGALCEGICISLVKSGFDTLVSGDPALSQQAALAWTGSEYGVAWRDERDGNREIYFAMVSAAGVKLTPDFRITIAAGNSVLPSLVWTGTEFGVAWVDARDGNNEIYFNRISTAGVPITTDLRVTVNMAFSGQPSLVWTGAEYAIAWADDRAGNREVFFNRLDEVGVLAGPDVQVTTTDLAVSEQPSLRWDGTAYGLAWVDERDGNREIYFNRLDTAGTPLAVDLRLTVDVAIPAVSAQPSLVWTGSEYALAWTDERDGNREIYFARVSALGVKQGTDVRITNQVAVSEQPSLDWTGVEYGVAWRDTRNLNGEVFLARIDAAGVKQGVDLRISNDLGLVSLSPELVWSGTQHSVAWHDIEISLARVDCGCLDGDGDGFSECIDCDDALATVFPGAPQICDGRNNDCDHPSWPMLPDTNEADADGDGFSECDGDCNPFDGGLWATPQEVRNPRLSHDPVAAETTLAWEAPVPPGSQVVQYDTMRSQDPGNFQAAFCVDKNRTNLVSMDADDPLPGEVFYYLVRAENGCPVGLGHLGFASDGTLRTAPDC